MIPIVCIEGATATGKSALAIELAVALGAQIISADSRQVYRYMDIGTAKVSQAEQSRIVHHLVDIINPNESYNAGRFCADARTKIREMHNSNMLPIICGGTGLYVRSLLHGLCALPPISPIIRGKLEGELQQSGLAALYHELGAIDPEAAAKISSNDSQRTLRALEVYRATGIPLSEHWRRQGQAREYRAFRILIDVPRAHLYSRIDNRMKEMLEAGLISEIKGLLERGYTPTDPGLNCLGYKEFIPFLLGQCTSEEAENLAAQHHRNLAKRQCTWYRKYSFDLTLAANDISLSTVIRTIKEFLIEADNADYSQSTEL